MTYSYTPDGRLATRTWARGETTTYTYDPNTGDLRRVDYSDAETADVEYTYRRFGGVETVQDAAGTRRFWYLSWAHPQNGLRPYREDLSAEGGGLIALILLRFYADAELPGRAQELYVVRDLPGFEYLTTWSYDDYGRLERVTGPGLPGDGVKYVYEANSDLVEETQYVDGSDAAYGAAIRSFEDHRDGVEGVTNRWKLGINGPMSTVSQYDYLSDAVGRRTSVVNTGAAFGAGRWILDTPRRTQSVPAAAGFAASRHAASQGGV